MTPDVVVDIGNSRIKWGRCLPTVADGGMVSLPPDDFNAWDDQAEGWRIEPGAWWAIAGVNPDRVEMFTQWVKSAGGSPVVFRKPSLLPIQLAVDEPDAVGIDRVLGALAAKSRVAAHTPAITVDIGTAVTVNLIDADGVFQGGVIFPGPRLMARSLHEYTAKLPLVEPRPLDAERTVGRNTREAIESGIQAALIGAADVLIWNISRTVEQKLRIFVTGGGMSFLRGIGLSADVEDIEYVPTLTLDGIRIAAEALP